MSNLSTLTAEQRQLLEALLEEEGANPNAILPIARRPDSRWAPLSSAQQRMWFAYRQSPEDPSYNIQIALNIKGNLNVTSLRKAVESLIKRHESLRTSFSEQSGQIVQIIHEPYQPMFQCIQHEDELTLDTFIKNEALRPWDLSQSQSLRTTLIQTARHEHVFLLGMHHILSDAWSVGILIRELWEIYKALEHDQNIDFKDASIQYADFAYWENNLANSEIQIHRDFWKSKLTDAIDFLELPLDYPRHQIQSQQAEMLSWTFSTSAAQAAHQLSQNSRCSIFSVLLSTFYLLLAEQTASQDLLLASPVANRERAEFESIIGYFSNTVVMRAEWSDSESFSEFLKKNHINALEVLSHQGFPFERIVEDFNPQRISGVNPLVQVFFAFQQYELNSFNVEQLNISEFENATRSTRFDLEGHVWETDAGGIEALFIYPPIFERSTITKWFTRWSELLELACARQNDPLGTLLSIRPDSNSIILENDIFNRIESTLLQRSSIKKVSVQVNSDLPEIEYISPQELYVINEVNPPKISAYDSIHQNAPARQQLALLEGELLGPDLETIATLPDLLIRANSLFPNSGCFFISTNQEISYQDLLSEAQRIQGYLQNYGFKPGDVLFFQLDSEQAVITYFWGAVFAGIVPLIQSPANPAQSQSYDQVISLWELLDRPVLLVDSRSASAWAAHSPRFLNIENINLSDQTPAPLPHRAQPHDIAFFSQSSGTSGFPKGIPLSHQNLISRAIGARDLTAIDSSRVMLNWQPLHHIGSISDWHIRGIAAGAKLIYGSTTEVLAQPLRWLDWIDAYQVTDSWAPNYAFTRIIEELDRPEHFMRRWDLSRLRLCLCAGESIVTDILDQFEDRLDRSGLKLGVLQPAFGMAETASGTTYHLPIPGKRVIRHTVRGEFRSFVSCGVPIPGISVRVVNDHDDLCKEEEIGHIQFHGLAVFSGYFKENELNHQRFTQDQWLKTGDLGFILDGHLFITGRDKAEIIINGRNISSESIEMHVGTLPGIRAGHVAVCTVYPKDSIKERICIFFTQDQPDESQEFLRKLSGSIVQNYGFIPDFLIPISAGDIPRTSLGKIRRHLLSEQFNKGKFDQFLREQSIQRNFIPDCFYQKKWQRQPLRHHVQEALTIYLLSRGSVVAQHLERRLLQNGHHARIIQHVDQVIHAECYLVDLSLFESIPDSNIQTRSLFVVEHLRTLLQALSLKEKISCRYTVVTRLTQATGRESDVHFSDAVSSGLLKSASQDLAGWLKIQNIDLDETSPEIQVDQLLREVQATRFVEEVVYRNNRRFEPTIQRIHLNSGTKNHRLPFDNKGFILVSGGMGGIGRILSTRLHDEFNFKLLVIGRSSPDEIDQRILNTRPNMAYAQVDISDKQALELAVSSQEEIWNLPLNSVLHLAGTGNWLEHTSHIHEHRVTGLNSDSWLDQFKAKISGTLNLFELTHKRPASSFIAASSLLGIFGGPGFSVYAAANSFLQTFCLAKTQLGYPATYCFSWPSWLDTGMSVGQRPDMSAAAGYLTLTPEAGWHIFLASLMQKKSDLLIGIDPNHPKSGYKKSIVAYYESDDEAAAARDIATIPELRWVHEKYSLDFKFVSQNSTEPFNHASTNLITHDNRAEIGYQQKLKLIFQDVLKIDKINLDDNFFELGAHSLLMAAIEARVVKEVNEHLELLDLFRFPTIRRLARYIVSLSNKTDSTKAVDQIPSTERNSVTSSQAQLRQARQKHRQGQTS